jgi:cysteine desulfurase / selenocysteine lyase
MMDEAAVRRIRAEEFPATANTIHLKAAGGSPMCRSAYDAGERYLREMCFEGDLYYDTYLDALARGRARIGAYIGVDPSMVGYAVNSSSAAAIMAEMFFSAGVARVYYPRSEFPTSVHALAGSGIALVPVGATTYQDDFRAWLHDVETHLESTPADGRAALVISHVSFLSGETIDIDVVSRFARDKGLLLAVNATQSFGALEIDAAGVDVLFATGLKWACAGYGAGFVYLRQGFVDEVGLPNRAGWLSVSDPYRMNPANTAPAAPAAVSLDAGGGMPHFGPLMALDGALSVYEALGEGDIREGIAMVADRVRHLAGYLTAALDDAGYVLLGTKRARSGIVSIMSTDAATLFDKLKRAGVLTSLRRDPGTGETCVLRFGVHYFNTKKELDKALSVLR